MRAFSSQPLTSNITHCTRCGPFLRSDDLRLFEKRIRCNGAISVRKFTFSLFTYTCRANQKSNPKHNSMNLARIVGQVRKKQSRAYSKKYWKLEQRLQQRTPLRSTWQPWFVRLPQTHFGMRKVWAKRFTEKVNGTIAKLVVHAGVRSNLLCERTLG